MGEEAKAKAEAMEAKRQFHNVALGQLLKLVEEEEQRQKRDVESVVECNWGCGKKFPPGTSKKEKHFHRSEECSFRPVRCPECGMSGIRFVDLDLHKAAECPVALLACRECQVLVPREELDSGLHARQKCPKRKVSCMGEGCAWIGPFEDQPLHALLCPYAIIDCPDCLEPMARYEMQSHDCPLVDGRDPCIACMEPLGMKSVALLLQGARRACGHIQMCIACARTLHEVQLQKADKYGTTAVCAICREPYDMVAAFPEHLIVDPPEGYADFAAEPCPPAQQAAPKAARGKKASQTAAAPPPATQRPAAPSPKAKAKATPMPKQAAPAATVGGYPSRPAPTAPTQRVSRPKAPQPPPKAPAPSQVAVMERRGGVAQISDDFTQLSLGTSLGAEQWPSLDASPIPRVVASPPSSLQAIQWKPTWSPSLEEFRRTAPSKTSSNTIDWQTFWISANEVHFTHDSINEYFQDSQQLKNGTILLTVEELATAKEIPKQLERIDVVWIDDRKRWFVAGTFNRRLCVQRLLHLFLSKKFQRIQVRRVPYDSVKWIYNGRHKMSTTCDGEGVEVRYEKWVGKDRSALRWPAALDLGKRLSSQQYK